MGTVVTSLSIIGSLAVFMVGFQQVSQALLDILGPWFKSRITSEQSGPLGGFLNGAAAASLTLSNASGVVLLISLANLGLVEILKTPWILLGINLGATFTGWIAALGGYIPGLSALGFMLLALSLPFKISSVLSEFHRGDALTGLGLLLLGIDLLNGSLPLVPQDPALIHHLRFLAGSPYGAFLALLAGGLMAALIRSSVGVLVLAMSLAFRGWLPLELAAQMVLGSYLGLTIIGFLASRNLGKQARRTAFLHLLLNAFASLWALLALPWILEGVNALLPGEGFRAGDIPLRLALFHSLVHLLNPLLVWPALPLLMMASRQLGERPRAGLGKAPDNSTEGSSEVPSFTLRLLSSNLPDSLDSNLMILQSGLARMAERAYEILMNVMNASQSPEISAQVRDHIREILEEIKPLGTEISQALTRCVSQASNQNQALRIQQQQRIVQELLEVGDSCWKILLIIERGHKKSYRFHDTSREELFDYAAQVMDFLRYNSDYLEGRILQPDWELAKKMEDTIDKVRDRLKKRSRKFLEKNQDADPRGELAFIEIIGYLEHIGDNCLSISRTVPQLRKT